MTQPENTEPLQMIDGMFTEVEFPDGRVPCIFDEDDETDENAAEPEKDDKVLTPRRGDSI